MESKSYATFVWEKRGKSEGIFREVRRTEILPSTNEPKMRFKFTKNVTNKL